MDIKIKVKQEAPSESASKELEFMKHNGTSKWYDSEIGNKTEMKQEVAVLGCFSQTERQAFIKDFKKGKIDAYTYRNNMEDDTKTCEERSVSSDVCSENKGHFLPKDLINKEEYISDCKIEIKEESWWLERTAEAPSYPEEIKIKYQTSSTKINFNCDPLTRNDLSLTPKQNSSQIKETRKWDSDVRETFPIEDPLYSEHPGRQVDGKICSTTSIQQIQFHGCDINNKDITSKSARFRHNLTDKCGSAYKHDIYNKDLKKLSSLKQQSSAHETLNLHKCQVCERTFAQKSQINRHYLIHIGVKPHKCDICGKTFAQLSDLKRHTLIHKGVKPYKCGICRKTFTQMSSLKVHNMIHEGVKPHKCGICDKTFANLSKLKGHHPTHSGVKPHKCEVCEKTFTRMSNLKLHNLIHEGVKPHKCEICEKTFTQLSVLKRHNLIHKGIKPHKCEICVKTFTEKSKLKKHFLIHEGVKPHRCELCEKTFTHISNLKRHNVIHKEVK